MDWIPQTKSCCFCITLMAGTCIIGHLEAFFGVATIGYDLFDLQQAGSDADSALKYYSFLSEVLQAAIQVINGIILVLGVKTDKKSHVYLWIQVHIFLFVVAVISYILSVLIIPFTNEIVNVPQFEMVNLLYTIRSLVVYGFCIVVVNSYYIQQYRSQKNCGDDQQQE